MRDKDIVIVIGEVTEECVEGRSSERNKGVIVTKDGFTFDIKTMFFKGFNPAALQPTVVIIEWVAELFLVA